MPVPKLPKTKVRLATSITIRLIPEDKLGVEALADPSALASMALKTSPIGAVEQFEEANERTAYPRFQMDAERPGEVTEVYPGLVSKRTLTIRRAVLYETDAVEVFNIDGDVVQQSKAFAMIKVEATPEGSGLPDRVTVYRKCWLETNPKTYQLQTDLKVIQNVRVVYAEREVVPVSKLS